ncbi:5567_t:CDS:1, partial [Cetraspora pellucida]
CPLARSWIGRCWRDIIGFGEVIVISRRSGGVITHSGAIISLGGGSVIGLGGGAISAYCLYLNTKKT